jgi:hypothetical protein
MNQAQRVTTVRLPRIGDRLDVTDTSGLAVHVVRRHQVDVEFHGPGDAVAAGLDRRLVPFVAIYALILAIASPILAANSRPIARLVPARWFPFDELRAPETGTETTADATEEVIG